MAQLRLKGVPIGSDLGTVSASNGAMSDSTVVPQFLKPSVMTGLPRISDGFDTDTLSLDTTGLTGITAYEWRIVGGAVQGTGTTLSGAGLGGQWIECEVTCDQGTRVSPPMMVYRTTHMGMAMPASHIEDERSILSIIPHASVTHIALADGNWTDPAIWSDGEKPKNGAVVLIPNGITVTYDEPDRFRLDHLRVDGTLSWALDRSTVMIVDTLLGTRGSTIVIGTSDNRIPAAYTHEIIISGRDYAQQSYTPTNLSRARDERLWGRGLIGLGTTRMWGTEKLAWGRAEPIEAGATSLTMRDIPTGWTVGDTLLIGGTSLSWTSGQPLAVETEEVTITAISGNTVSWSGGLTYPHKNQLVGSTRTDLYPVVALRRGRNIIIRSETPDLSHQRGHTAFMHHDAIVDIWAVEFRDLGRTDKSKATPAGVIPATGDFKFYDDTDTDETLTRALADDDNLQSRYPIHLHKLGFMAMMRPVVSDCFVDGSPGWAIVHHDCDADFFNNVMYRFFGAGMVSESANELGAWVNNLALDTTYDENDALTSSPKVREGDRGQRGDAGRFGYGFFFRGRAMRTNANVACGCTWGYVFHHRAATNPATAVSQLEDPKRDTLDLSSITAPVGFSDNQVAKDAVKFVHYPIIHFADNESIACRIGFFVTKNLPDQEHDANVKLKRFKVWGQCDMGVHLEYIGTYILDGFDVVKGTRFADGMRIGTNTYQVMVRNGRIEGHNSSFLFRGGEPNTEGSTVNYTPDNPRWAVISTDMVDNGGNDIEGEAIVAGSTFDGIFRREDDWDGTLIDYDRDPSWTFPLECGVWDGTNNGVMTTSMQNSDGKKVDNLSSTAMLAPTKELVIERIFPSLNSQMRWQKRREGWYQYGGSDVIVAPMIISDRVTGRPHKYTTMYRVTGPLNPENGPGDQGAFSYTTTAVTRPDVITTVAENGTVTVEALAGAAGGGGAGTYAIDQKDYIAPDHGKVAWDYANDRFTYTPDRGYIGPDEFYYFVQSHGQYATVRVDILVGPGGAVSTPGAGTDFAVTGDSGAIDVELFDQPFCGHRRVVRTQYSTDGGATWRRLTNFWVKAIHQITVASDGTALLPGTYDLRIRYQTDYDYTTSAASADVTTVVTAA